MADTNKTFVPADAFSTVDHDEYAAAEAQAKKSELVQDQFQALHFLPVDSLKSFCT